MGRTVFVAYSVDSTNEWAKQLAKLGACEGTVVVAETQTKGHGRLGRRWLSPVGGLWFSAILKPKLKAEEAVQLVFVASLAVAEVLHELYGLQARVKWPNDVLIKDRKVCGILAESSTTNNTVDYVVVGVGINANFDVKKALPEHLWSDTTSVRSELGRKVRFEKLFVNLIEKMEKTYGVLLKDGFVRILSDWKRYACFLGRAVCVNDGAEKLSGLAIDVNRDGSLVVQLENGVTRHFLVGDISLRVH